MEKTVLINGNVILSILYSVITCFSLYTAWPISKLNLFYLLICVVAILFSVLSYKYRNSFLILISYSLLLLFPLLKLFECFPIQTDLHHLVFKYPEYFFNSKDVSSILASFLIYLILLIFAIITHYIKRNKTKNTQKLVQTFIFVGLVILMLFSAISNPKIDKLFPSIGGINAFIDSKCSQGFDCECPKYNGEPIWHAYCQCKYISSSVLNNPLDSEPRIIKCRNNRE